MFSVLFPLPLFFSRRHEKLKKNTPFALITPEVYLPLGVINQTSVSERKGESENTGAANTRPSQ
jgi:hypothetical protein